MLLVVLSTVFALSCAQPCKTDAECREGDRCVQKWCVMLPSRKCPERMHFSECASACPERCGQPKPVCVAMCVEACVCDEGYVLGDDAVCIPRNECSSAGLSVTNDKCATVKCSKEYKCVDGTCVLRCPVPPLVPPPPGCTWITRENGDECPKYTLECPESRVRRDAEPTEPVEDAKQCPANAEFRNCTNLCPSSTCATFAQKQLCFSLRCGPPGCACKEGYVWKTRDNSLGCIRVEECPEFASIKKRREQQVTRRCGRNEHFTNCGTACEPTCERPFPEICTMNCIVDVCQCNTGFVRHKTKGCVPLNQC